MPVAAKFATQPPGRLEWHPAHGDPKAEDPKTFHLHVEFVNAHGLPKGQFTTFSTCNPILVPAARGGGNGVRGT